MNKKRNILLINDILLKYLDDAQYKNIIKLLKEQDKTNWKTIPGAIKHHHNYEGGLLQHITEVVFNMDTIIQEKKIEKNTATNLIVAALLHDWGKTLVYAFDDTGNPIYLKNNAGVIQFSESKAPNKQGEWKVRPLAICCSKSYSLISNSLDDNLFDKNFIKQAIANHHGKVSWQANSLAMSTTLPDSGLVFIADYASSKASNMDNYSQESALKAAGDYLDEDNEEMKKLSSKTKSEFTHLLNITLQKLFESKLL